MQVRVPPGPTNTLNERTMDEDIQDVIASLKNLRAIESPPPEVVDSIKLLEEYLRRHGVEDDGR